MERCLALTVTAVLVLGCAAGKLVDEAAREILWVRLTGFIIVIAIAFFFVIRNLRKK